MTTTRQRRPSLHPLDVDDDCAGFVAVECELATPASTPSSESSSAPATSATSSAEWDEIVAKAQDEGKVTIYSSQGLDLLNELAAKFEEKYGITLEVVRGIDSELIPKVDAETQTGNRVADVFAFASPQWGQDNAAKGLFVAPTGRPSMTRRSTRRRWCPTTAPCSCPPRRCSATAGTPTVTPTASRATKDSSIRRWRGATSA